MRRQLPWSRRFFSDASTLGLWTAWLWLCLPAIGAVEQIRHADLQQSLAHLIAAGIPATAERGALALFSVAGALLIWKKLTERRKHVAADQPSPNYASHFGLSETQLRNYRASRICVVSHDNQGRITGVEPTLPPAPTLALASVETPAPAARELEIAEAA